MKRNILIVILGIIVMACSQPKHDGYLINGNIQGVNEGKIVLSIMNEIEYTEIKLDSAVIKNGKFKLKGRLDCPNQCFVTIYPNKCTFGFWMENSKMSLSGNIVDMEQDEWGYKRLPMKVTGSSIQDEFDKYELLSKPIAKERAPFDEAYNIANENYSRAIDEKKSDDEVEVLKELVEKAKSDLEPFAKMYDEINDKYIKEHPNSLVTASIITYRLHRIKPLELKKIFDRFSDDVKRSQLGREIEHEIKKGLEVAAGNMASSFAKPDINGEFINLEDYRGQYVLLDFWASWCGPCRAGNPHLISLYNKYHDKGIEIIGIASDDGSEKAWRKAVKKDQIGIWRHILNGTKKQGNDIGDMYSVKSLPTKVLIDPEGKIIGRYGGDGDSDEDMDDKLKEIFGF